MRFVFCKDCFCKKEGSGDCKKFFWRRLGCFPLRSACSALRYADGLATIQTLQKVLPDIQLKPIFSTSFRKDYYRQVVQYHCIHRHNVVLYLQLCNFVTDFLSGFSPRFFTASSSHFLQKSVTKFSLFWNFLSRNRWFFPLHSPWDFFLMKINFEWFFGLFDDFSPSSAFWPLLSEFYCILGAKGEIQKWGVTPLVVCIPSTSRVDFGKDGAKIKWANCKFPRLQLKMPSTMWGTP